jgi:hypothetical protein
MKKARTPILPSCVLLLALMAFEAHAQSIGIGAGLAVPNDNIAQVTSDLARNGWSGAVESAKSGYYVELRGRLGGSLALIGGVGYNTFSASRSTYFDGSNREVAFNTSQTIIPISLGADMRLAEGFMVPYLTLEATYNIYHRSFERPNGDVSSPFDIKSVNDTRLGAAVGGGVNLDLKVAELSIGGKLHVPNLLNQEQGESEIYYAQLGATLYFGM